MTVEGEKLNLWDLSSIPCHPLCTQHLATIQCPYEAAHLCMRRDSKMGQDQPMEGRICAHMVGSDVLSWRGKAPEGSIYTTCVLLLQWRSLCRKPSCEGECATTATTADLPEQVYALAMPKALMCTISEEEGRKEGGGGNHCLPWCEPVSLPMPVPTMPPPNTGFTGRRQSGKGLLAFNYALALQLRRQGGKEVGTNSLMENTNEGWLLCNICWGSVVWTIDLCV